MLLYPDAKALVFVYAWEGPCLGRRRSRRSLLRARRRRLWRFCHTVDTTGTLQGGAEYGTCFSSVPNGTTAHLERSPRPDAAMALPNSHLPARPAALISSHWLQRPPATTRLSEKPARPRRQHPGPSAAGSTRSQLLVKSSRTGQRRNFGACA